MYDITLEVVGQISMENTFFMALHSLGVFLLTPPVLPFESTDDTTRGVVAIVGVAKHYGVGLRAIYTLCLIVI